MDDQNTNAPIGDPPHLGMPDVRKMLLVFFVPIGIALLLVALFMPLERGPREAAPRTQCKNNLKQIGIALHNYHETYGSFPPAYTVDEIGNRLHSWRTLLLPFLDYHYLYRDLDLSKPWDDPVNSKVFQHDFGPYHYYCRCPAADIPENHTTYQVVISPDGLFHNDTSKTLADITDGAANTLMVIEVPEDRAIHWMSPYDTTGQTIWSINGKSKLSHDGGVRAVFADGSVRFISVGTPIDERQAMITIAAGDNELEEKEAEKK